MPKNSMGEGELLKELAYLDQAEYIDKQAYAQLVKIVEQSGFIESALRRELWMNHGCPFAALYGDDGEIQCGQCLVDFKRMPIADLVQKIADQRLARAALEIAKQADTQAEQSGEVDEDILIGRIGWMVSEISQRRVMTDVELKDIERIKQLLQQPQRQVSREEIMKVVKRINDEITPGGMITARMVEIAYEELGMRIEDTHE